jgi:hypothetical protein
MPHRVFIRVPIHGTTGYLILFSFLITILTATKSIAEKTTIDSSIIRLMQFISPDSIYNRINQLQAFGTRYAFSEKCRDTEQYIYDYLSLLKLDSVAFDSFSFQNVTMRNVIGTIHGNLDPTTMILVCAHLDAMSNTPFICAPGAEDNASGIAVILETARALKDIQPFYTIKFITFSGEDVGLAGSKHYVDAFSSSCTRISALLNLDMVAWPGGAFGVKILCDTISKHIATIENDAARRYTLLDPQIIMRSPLPSDNYPFQIKGYPCVSNIERMEHDTDGYKCYHTCCDTLGNLSMPLAAEVAKTITATICMLMDLPAPPTGLVAQVSEDKKNITLSWMPNSEKDIAEYRIYWGKKSHNYTDSAAISLENSYRIAKIDYNALYYFSIKAIDSIGNFSAYSCEETACINEDVLQYSNQFLSLIFLKIRKYAHMVEIEYSINEPQFIRLSIFDARGRKLETLLNKWQSKGIYRVKLDPYNFHNKINCEGVIIAKINGYLFKIINI